MGSGIRSNLFLRELCLFSPFLRRSGCAPPAVLHSTTAHIAIGGIRCAAAQSSDGGSQGKTSARLSLMKQVLRDAEERALSAGSEPIPKISLAVAFFLNSMSVSEGRKISGVTYYHCGKTGHLAGLCLGKGTIIAVVKEQEFLDDGEEDEERDDKRDTFTYNMDDHVEESSLII